MKLHTLEASKRQAFKLICNDFHIGTFEGIRPGAVRKLRIIGAGAGVDALERQLYIFTVSSQRPSLIEIDPQHSNPFERRIPLTIFLQRLPF